MQEATGVQQNLDVQRDTGVQHHLQRGMGVRQDLHVQRDLHVQWGMDMGVQEAGGVQRNLYV